MFNNREFYFYHKRERKEREREREIERDRERERQRDRERERERDTFAKYLSEGIDSINPFTLKIVICNLSL